jgi:peptidoglycan DL-endopeptidase CwlO
MRALAVLGVAILAGCERHDDAVYPASGWDAQPPLGSPALPWRPAYPGERAAAAAMSWQGRPYCWGGAGPDCFDCSGLTWAAWRAAGVPIPRSSDAQHEALLSVSMETLAPGDILWRPGHVGMYVGRGWVVHAPGTGKAVQLQAAWKFESAHRPVW